MRRAGWIGTTRPGTSGRGGRRTSSGRRRSSRAIRSRPRTCRRVVEQMHVFHLVHCWHTETYISGKHIHFLHRKLKHHGQCRNQTVCPHPSRMSCLPSSGSYMLLDREEAPGCKTERGGKGASPVLFFSLTRFGSPLPPLSVCPSRASLSV